MDISDFSYDDFASTLSKARIIVVFLVAMRLL